MKILTLTQPYATLVAIGAKQIETRSWRTSFRGTIAVHSALGFPGWARRLVYTEPFRSVLMRTGLDMDDILDWLPRGKIIATCTVETIVPTLSLANLPTEPELSFGDYAPGRFAWFLGNINPITVPIPAKGKLGLWEYDQL